MTRYIRRSHRADHPCFEYVHASRELPPWAHPIFALLIVVAVLLVSAAFGWGQP